MSQFSSFPSTAKTSIHLSSRLFSDFLHLCSLMLSHPVYLTYVVFFAPYIMKVLSFLSPLFITTSLLLALFTTLLPSLIHDDSYIDPKPSCLLATLARDHLSPNSDNETQNFASIEELEAYRMVFESCPPELSENPTQFTEVESKETGLESQEVFVDKFCSHESSSNSWVPIISQESNGGTPLETPMLKIEEERTCEKEVEEVKPLSAVFNKVEVLKRELSKRRGSKARDSNEMSETKVIIDNDVSGLTGNCQEFGSFLRKTEIFEENNPIPTKIEEGTSLKSFGSMRKEKEWRRTLACKLFEERHNNAESGGGGGEGMDLLWETYEAEVDNKSQTKTTKSSSKKEHEEQEYDEDCDNGQLCCLQALKFSTGKMRLGVGRPNLVKISKALKGFGWLHHVSKHGKKA